MKYYLIMKSYAVPINATARKTLEALCSVKAASRKGPKRLLDFAFRKRPEGTRCHSNRRHRRLQGVARMQVSRAAFWEKQN